jgi:membrane-bound lytic murein transglycosylase F
MAKSNLIIFKKTCIMVVLTLILVFLVEGCSLKEKRIQTGSYQKIEKQKVENKFSKRFPLQTKKLVVLCTDSPYDYAIVKGTPVGLAYELLHLFAQDNGLDLQVKTVANRNQLLDNLKMGNGDIAVTSLYSASQSDQIRYTLPLLTTNIRLIERTNSEHIQMSSYTADSSRTDLQVLNGKKIIVLKKTSLKDSLKVYKRKHHLNFIIEEAADSLTQEDLIEMVASGKIDYTAAEGNVAEAMGAYQKKINTHTQLMDSFPVTWAVNVQAVGVLEAVNKWIVKRKGSLAYNMIVNKYTQLSKREKKAIQTQFVQAKTRTISHYDELLKSYANGWDWRLLAALVYQESKFDPKARSQAGAIGLMQVLPATAKWLGNKPAGLQSPQDNIHAGMQYLQWLKAKWEQIIADEDEVIKFTLASYNVGFGHVQDARLLAKKYHLNPLKWEGNVEKMLLAKSKAKFYQDPAVKYGYCRGKEPVNYVQNILYYYQHYQNI